MGGGGARRCHRPGPQRWARARRGASVNYGVQNLALGHGGGVWPDDLSLYTGEGTAFGACAGGGGAGRRVRNEASFCVQCGFIWTRGQCLSSQPAGRPVLSFGTVETTCKNLASSNTCSAAMPARMISLRLTISPAIAERRRAVSIWALSPRGNEKVSRMMTLSPFGRFRVTRVPGTNAALTPITSF